MTTAFMVFRPFAPDLEVHLTFKRDAYHLKIICRNDHQKDILRDEHHTEPAEVLATLATLIYSRSTPNIGTLSRLVYGLKAHPELALREFRGVSIDVTEHTEHTPYIERQ